MMGGWLRPLGCGGRNSRVSSWFIHSFVYTHHGREG